MCMLDLSMAGSHIYISEKNILSQLCRTHNSSARIEWTMPKTTKPVLCHQSEAMLRFLQSFQKITVLQNGGQF